MYVHEMTNHQLGLGHFHFELAERILLCTSEPAEQKNMILNSMKWIL